MIRGSHAGSPRTLGSSLGLLTDSELRELQLATLEVLERTGIWAEDPEVIEIFAEGGCRVDRERKLVKIPERLVNWALQCAPTAITFCGRDPEKDVRIGGGRVNFFNHCASVKVIDLESGERRDPVVQDVVDSAIICDYLDEICAYLPAVDPLDCPSIMPVHEYHAAVRNITKHIHQPAYSGHEAEAIVEMAAAVVGGRDALRERPIVSLGTSPVAPLKLQKEHTDVVLVAVRAGVPFVTMNMPLAGATTPMSLAGTLVCHNALVLADCVLSQLVAPGASFWYGSGATSMDMRFGLATGGSPEQARLSAAAAQLSRYLGLPNQVLALWTDSKRMDAQAGHEKTLAGLTAALAGADMVEGAGMIENALTLHYGQLVMDNEIIKMIRGVLEGISVNDDELMLDEIHAAGPDGEYISRRSTAQRARRFSQPEVLDRQDHKAWMDSGATDAEAKANAEARRILSEHVPSPLADDVVRALDALLARAVETASVPEMVPSWH